MLIMKGRDLTMTFVKGLIVVTPIILTCYVVGGAMWWLDMRLRHGLDYVLGDSYPGLGIAVGVGGIYVVGLLTRTWLFRMLIRMGEGVVERIPLVKSLYSAIRDLLQFLGGSNASGRGVPAVLDLNDGAVKMLCIRTQETAQSFMPASEDRVAVYLPMSYQLGGFTLYVPREDVEQIDGMTVEQLLKLALTAGIGTGKAGLEPQGVSRVPQGDESSDGRGQSGANGLSP
jgi:uncharacterized membrane protein